MLHESSFHAMKYYLKAILHSWGNMQGVDILTTSALPQTTKNYFCKLTTHIPSIILTHVTVYIFIFALF